MEKFSEGLSVESGLESQSCSQPQGCWNPDQASQRCAHCSVLDVCICNADARKHQGSPCRTFLHSFGLKFSPGADYSRLEIGLAENVCVSRMFGIADTSTLSNLAEKTECPGFG